MAWIERQLRRKGPYRMAYYVVYRLNGRRVKQLAGWNPLVAIKLQMKIEHEGKSKRLLK